ncbi:MAG TPA: hypothetical protein VFU54_12230 [Actinomycetota bacterium]|nr:hypothetical protein [Actinomycetota bacterium]
MRSRRARWLVPLLLVTGLLVSAPVGTAQGAPEATQASQRARFSNAVAFDVSPAMRDVAKQATSAARASGTLDRPERGPASAGRGFSGDAAVQSTTGRSAAALDIPSPTVNFEGIPAEANIPILGGIPIPPDPVGDVGPNHYVEMVNTAWAVFSKTGTLLLGPLSLASIWAGFAVPDCEDNSGDPIVLHDQLANRWILTQFTTLGPTFYNCVAVSSGPDPTGSYFRYAFSTGINFPDYPKYGVWPNAYFLTTREFGPATFAGIGVYALERRKMINGNPDARAVSILVPPGRTPWITGDGWLPSDLDGSQQPPDGSPNYIAGTQDDEGPYGAPFDALNLFKFSVIWSSTPKATFTGPTQLPVAEFDSDFPCSPAGSRHCIPQPDTPRKLDILSYRQRPIWRLAYRNLGTHESLVTNQSVEARPELAGTRWYEIRSPGSQPVVAQQATYAPDDGVHRWMGSIAQDKQGNMALGYSVSNATDVFPGIRYSGRLAGDPAGTLPQGEGIIVNGGGSQTDRFSRWGDYTSMNIDPTDDCTFWYVNQYYDTTSARGWNTRIAAFRMPGCS